MWTLERKLEKMQKPKMPSSNIMQELHEIATVANEATISLSDTATGRRLQWKAMQIMLRWRFLYGELSM